MQNYTEYVPSLNLDGLEFPVQIKHIDIFEKNNPFISIDVYYFDEESKGFSVERRTENRDRQNHINLLILDDPDDSSLRHYTWIKNMSSLIAHRSKHAHKQYVCNSCLHPFSSSEILERHVPYCIQHQPQQLVYPNADDEKDCTLTFRSHQKQHPIPIYLVCDLESFLVPKEEEESKSRSLQYINEHQVSGFAVYRVTPHEKYQKPPFVYSGPEPIVKFYDYLTNEAREISYIVRQQVDMLPLSLEQALDYDDATTGANCQSPFTKDNRKVHRHCHVSGNYLFATCNRCNLYS